MTVANKLHATETSNLSSRNSHAQSTSDILRGINAEDATIASAVAAAIPSIDAFVTKTITALQNGGRLFYIGAGTSGRLGVLDASECPPTFGVSDDMVQGIIAGGDNALRLAGEGAEDNGPAGIDAVKHLTANDVLLGVSASGSAVYVREAIRAAKARGIFTGALCTAPDAPLLSDADCAILADTGAEYIAGSTRMKSGTAQKMILNMISSTVMIGLGKVYAGFMIDVKTSNQKLHQRANAIIATLSGCTLGEAAGLVAAIGDKTASPVKPAIVMVLERVDYDDAVTLLNTHHNRIDAIMKKHGRDVVLGCA